MQCVVDKLCCVFYLVLVDTVIFELAFAILIQHRQSVSVNN